MPSLKQLQYFSALANGKNMSKLAEEYYISQTALSNSIARLEKELGVNLFDRVGRNIVLNDYGKLYLQYIEPALNSIMLGQQAISNIHHKDINSVSIAIASSHLWGDMIGAFLTNHPNFSISQRECNVDMIKKQLPELDIDLIVSGATDFDSPYLDSVSFIRDKVRLYVPLNNPLAGRESIYLHEARDESFIFQPKHAGFSRFSEMLFKKAGFKPNVVAECDTSLRRDLLRKGVGVVLASDSVLRARFFDNCNCVPVLVKDDFAVREMSCFWLKSRPLSPPAVAFRNHLLEYYAGVSQG